MSSVSEVGPNSLAFLHGLKKLEYFELDGTLSFVFEDLGIGLLGLRWLVLLHPEMRLRFSVCNEREEHLERMRGPELLICAHAILADKAHVALNITIGG